MFALKISGLLAAAIACLALTGFANADEGERSYQQVVGIAQFEKHQTIVALPLCGELPCQQSEAYWTLVLKSKRVRYEINVPFEEGRTIAPEFIEMDGAKIHLGSKVQIAGKIQFLSRDYAIVSEVKDLKIVADSSAENLSILPIMRGWNCQSDGIFGAKVFTDVFFDPGQSGGDYRINVTSGEGESTKQQIYIGIASVLGQATEEAESQVVFAGSNAVTQLRLTIRASRLPQKTSFAVLELKGSNLDSSIAQTCEPASFQ